MTNDQDRSGYGMTSGQDPMAKGRRAGAASVAVHLWDFGHLVSIGFCVLVIGHFLLPLSWTLAMFFFPR
jgi:hypothetical protein